MSEFADLMSRLRAFAADRNWERYHTAKNLAMAVSVEAAELLEEFQWLTPEQASELGEEAKSRVSEEIADVMMFLLRLADVCDIEPIQAVVAKLERNEQRIPPGDPPPYRDGRGP